MVLTNFLKTKYMNQIETVIEKKGIAWLMSRVQSKSPKLYCSIQVVGGIVILALAPLTIEIQTGAMVIPHSNIILPICQFLCALLAGAGVTAMTTTTDPKLISPETVSAVKEAAKNDRKITTDPNVIGPPLPQTTIEPVNVTQP